MRSRCSEQDEHETVPVNIFYYQTFYFKNHKIFFFFNLRIHSWEFTYFHFLMNFMVSELSWTRGPISYFWLLVLSGRKKPTWLRGSYKYSWIHWFIESLKIHQFQPMTGELVFWPDQISCPSSRWLKYSVQFRGPNRRPETVLSHSN